MCTIEGCIAIKKDGNVCGNERSVLYGSYCDICWKSGEGVEICKGKFTTGEKKGQKCTRKVKDGTGFCGLHKIQKNIKNKPEENKPEENKPEENKPEEETKALKFIQRENDGSFVLYFLKFGNGFKVGMKNDSIIFTKMETNYNEEEFNKQFKNNTVNSIEDFTITEIPKLLKYKESGKRCFRYFIGIKHINIQIVFIPIINTSRVIVNFARILYEDFFKVSSSIFYLAKDKEYPTNSKKSLHELIQGKPAEKGGWKLVLKNNPDNHVKALWITMISGRSINQYDPNPETLDFYYYFNEDNGFNIKVSAPTNFVFYEEMPTMKQGEQGDCYCDIKGNVYVKIDEHNIDHMDRQKMNGFNTNLREITIYANGANKNTMNGKFLGVETTDSGFRGRAGKDWKYNKTFPTKEQAARFHDYYTLAIYGVMVATNNTLTKEEQNNLLLYGIDAIPDEYLYKKKEIRDFPTGICKTGGYYLVQVNCFNIKMAKYHKKLEDALATLDIYRKKETEMRAEKRLETLQKNINNFDDKYGYINITNDEKIIRVKLNLETYLIFVHCNWHLKNGRPAGLYNGKTAELHIHVLCYYIKDYDKRSHGTGDHRFQDGYDCTIEHLRPASASLQSHNKYRKNVLGYSCIYLSGDGFEVRQNYTLEQLKEIANNTNDSGKKDIDIIKIPKSKNFKCDFLEDAIIIRNKIILEQYGKDSLGNPIGNLIPELNSKNTRVKNLYDISKLTTDDIKNADISELRSIYIVNPQIRELLNNEGFVQNYIKKANSEKIKDLILTIF